jgi:hypothetical protein
MSVVYAYMGVWGLLDIVVWDYDATIYGVSYPLPNPHILLLSINNNISKIYVDKYVDKLWITCV